MRNKIRKILSKKKKQDRVFDSLFKKYCEYTRQILYIILVGDSMANVLYGFNDTHNISIENIIQHTKSVRKGTKKSLLVVDMPKNTYNNSATAKRNARLVIKSTGCEAIKLESNKKNFHIIKELTKEKNSSDGPYGYTPQFKKI